MRLPLFHEFRLTYMVIYGKLVNSHDRLESAPACLAAPRERHDAREGQPTQTSIAREPIPQQIENKQRVRHQIALPQAPRFAYQTEKPFQTHTLHPCGRALDRSGVELNDRIHNDPSWLRSCGPSHLSQHRFQPLALDEAEQLQGGAARLLFADLPLAHGRQAGVEHGR